MRQQTWFWWKGDAKWSVSPDPKGQGDPETSLLHWLNTHSEEVDYLQQTAFKSRGEGRLAQLWAHTVQWPVGKRRQSCVGMTAERNTQKNQGIHSSEFPPKSRHKSGPQLCINQSLVGSSVCSDLRRQWSFPFKEQPEHTLQLSGDPLFKWNNKIKACAQEFG